MCGIDGFFSYDHSIGTDKFYRSHRLLAHRGPDDEAFVALTGTDVVHCRGDDTIEEFLGRPHIRELGQARAILGHRRLSIIDLSSCGHQPMSSQDGRYWLIYNGEIFNYLELRRELERLGHRFDGSSDTEVVLKSFIEWGEGCFERFNGMWALAIWDTVEETLLLSRDRFGIKPLFYAETSQGLSFASEMRFILALSDVSFVPNEQVAKGFVETGAIFDGSDTFWDGICEVEPGTHTTWTKHGAVRARYWELAPGTEITSLEGAVETFGTIVDQSLKIRMRSDVRVGSLLSGGLDSSLIVCRLHELGLLGSGAFATFSAVSEVEEFSEQRYVDLLASQLPIERHLVTLRHSEMDLMVQDVLEHIEVPFRSFAVIAQYQLYKKIRAETDVKVVLNGQGGDELFGGYLRHYFVLLGILLREFRPLRFARESRALVKNRNQHARRVLSLAMHHARQADSGWDYFNTATAREVTRSALREYLAYDDRNSMAFSIEARVPLLDYRMVEFAFSLHPDLKIKDFENKRIVREWAKGVVPEEIRRRRDKMGFTTPQESWQRQHMAPQMESALLRFEREPTFSFLARRDGGIDFLRNYISGTSSDWTRAWRIYALERWLTLHRLI